MHIIRLCVLVVARFLISLIFLASAVSKMIHWHTTESFLMNVLCEWQSYLGFSDTAQDCLTTMISLTPVLLLIATLFELLGGLSILLGVKEKLGASLLILFLIPTTILFHQFWWMEGSQREMQMIHFLKNLAILGGLFMVVLRESGASSQKQSFIPKF